MYRQSTSQLDYASDRVSVLSAQYSDRLSVHSADRPVIYDRQQSDDRHMVFSDRTGGGSIMDGSVIDTMGGSGGGGTVVRVSGNGGVESGPIADRGPPAGSHRVLLKLRHRSVVMVTVGVLVCKDITINIPTFVYDDENKNESGRAYVDPCNRQLISYFAEVNIKRLTHEKRLSY